MSITIENADLNSPDFSALVTAHTLFCDSTAPPESCHRLPLAALAHDDISVWQARHNDKIVGMGALKELSPTQGELKSMHTLSDCRGLGIGRLILQTLLDEAAARNYSDLWLETGVHPGFSSAHKLYASVGFVETGPFGDYELDPHSLFMTLNLTDGGTQ